MMVKASAASTLLFAAGIFFSLAGPLPAQAAGQDDTAASSKPESATSDKPVKHTRKREAHRKSEPAAAKSGETKKEKDGAEASNGAVPDAVANAKAQMMTANAASDSARAMSEAMSAKAGTVLASADKPAEAQAAADDATVVATDQLNDVDRALQQETPSTQTVAMAAAKPAGEDVPAAAAATNDSSSLDKTSLVGKVFIAFGALLTMASAARMFMA